MKVVGLAAAACPSLEAGRDCIRGHISTFPPAPSPPLPPPPTPSLSSDHSAEGTHHGVRLGQQLPVRVRRPEGASDGAHEPRGVRHREVRGVAPTLYHLFDIVR